MSSESYRIIKNKDGSPRWIFPANDDKAHYLKFYPAFNKRNKLLRSLMRVLAATGIQKLFTQKISDKDLSKLLGYTPSELTDVKDFALFTGTAGPNRKILLYEPTDDAYFSKIALGENAPKLIENEFRVLESLSQKRPKSFWFPKLFSFNDGVLKTHELKVKESSQQWTPGHSRFLEEIYAWGVQSVEAHNLFADELLNVDCVDPGAEEALKQLHKSLTASTELLRKQAFKLKTAFGHGDFCPWNTGLEGAKLQVLDWELAGDYPMLYDLFHFVVQHELLNTGSSARAIFRKVRDVVCGEDVRVLLKMYKLNWHHQFMAYMIRLCSYYYEVYSRQESLHPQGFRLINGWIQLLELGNAYLKEDSFRKQFVRELFQDLEHTDYALMKFFEEDIELLREESDLDLFIRKDDFSQVNEFASNSPLVSHSRTRKYSYMQSLEVFFWDGSFLSIDLICQLKRKALDYLQIDSVLSNAKLNSFGIKLPTSRDNFTYIAYFYTLNGAEVPEHYKIVYWHERKKASAGKNISKYLDAYFSAGLLADKQEKLMPEINDLSQNKGFSSVRNRFFYLIDSLRRLFRRDSLTLTFSGVDGAGKSTLIARLKQRLEQKYRKEIVVLRHRPSLLPILSAFLHGKEMAEQKAADSLPRQGGNESYLASYLRFSYYLLDYLFGEVFIWFRHRSRGKVILYDRYYFDFISDPRRSNLKLHQAFTKWMYAWIKKAEVNVFLYAPVEEILARKQELKAADIEFLSREYRELFDEFDQTHNQTYVNINNLDLEESLDLIESLYVKAA